MKRPKGVDDAVIKNLNRIGDNLEEERNVDFYLYFDLEHEAYAVGTELAKYLFKTNISYTSFSNQWLLLASKTMMVTTSRLIEIGNWMEELAAQNDGNYDGWETMVVKSENIN